MAKKKAEEGSRTIIEVEAAVVLDCLEWDIIILDRDFKVIFANKAFLDKSGMSLEEATRSFCYKITHHLDEPCKPPYDTCPLEEMIRTGKPAIETHTHFRKNNETFLANTVTAPIKGLSSERFLTNTIVSPMKSLGTDIFLHVSIVVKDPKKSKEEVANALEKTSYVLEVINTYQFQMEEMKNMRKNLESKLEELEEFNRLAVGREMKMMELKERIKELEKNQGK
jgi:hypothetical protein